MRTWARSWPVGAAIIAVVVLGVTRAWYDGRTTLDGNGVLLFVDIGLHYWRTTGHVPYWIPDMWTGAPVWALAPVFPVLVLLPLARAVGADTAIRLATVFLQIAGGCGAMTLAASLWRDEERADRLPVSIAAVVAGCLYALHPILISHGTLFGHQTTIAVLAVAPWLVWSVRRGLRGDGRPWIVLAGVLAAIAILDQAEHAYALVIICALVAIAQLAREWRRVLVRAAGVVVVIAGVLAHWLIPLRALSGSFVLSPPDVVTASLTNGIGAQLAAEPGAFLTRSPGLARVVTYDHPDLFRSGSFYLGWVWLLGSAATLVVLALRPRRDRDATLSALLLASALCVWMSTAATPLARSGPGLRHEWLPLAVIGALGGLCLGVYLRRVAGRRLIAVLAAGAVVLLFAVPYVTPFLVLQKLIPLAGNLRIPRLYPLAALGLSLGAAYPLTLLARRRRGEDDDAATLRRLGALAAAVALLAAGMVDAWPYRDFYRARPPADQAAYAAATAKLPSDGRVITEQFGDPRIVDDLYRSGHPQATGWPHPIAGRDVWPLAATPQEAAPPGYRDRAAGLAGARALVVEHSVVPPNPLTPEQAAAEARAATNPRIPAPPVPPGAVEVDGIGGPGVVRAYDHAVVVADDAPVTELAVGLAPSGLSIVRGGAAAARALGPVGAAPVPQGEACSSLGAEEGGDALGYSLAVACALHRWVGKYVGLNQTPLGSGVGAVFNAAAGMRGVALWILGPPGGVRVELRALSRTGALGQVLATVGPGPLDANGMVPFVFPSPLPAGQYGFEATCPSCPDKTAFDDASPRVVFTDNRPGDLIAGDRIATDLVAAFAPIYPAVPAFAPTSATVRTVASSPGRWDLDVRSDHAALVVVAESDFPGWHARVDGRSSPVLEADAAFLGVVVPAGAHRVTLRYRAPGVTLGDWISGLTLLACFVLVVPWRRIRSGLRIDRRPTTVG